MRSAKSSFTVAAVLAVAACGGPAAPATPDMAVVSPPDLSSVVERFTPSRVPLGQALGIAGPLPIGSDAPSVAGRKATLDHLLDLHMGVLRRDFLWSAIEPARGVLDFGAEDVAVDDTVARGVASIGTLAYNTPWASPTGDIGAPPDPDLYARFVAATVAHYRGRVTAWEIWNEENLGYRFWKPRQDAAAYATLLARAYPAAKEADPTATVVLGGLFWQDLGVDQPAEDYVNDLYAAHPDLGRFYDALGIHPYPIYPPSVAPEKAGDREVPLGLMLARMHALLGAYGDGDKPLWVTEYGWPVYGPVDEAAQARYLVRGAIEALAAGADRVCVYTLDDGPHPTAYPPEDAFGILHNDGSAKPAYGALRTLLAIDPGAVLVADDSAGVVRHYRFAGPRARFHALWSTDAGSHSVAVSAGAGARVLDEQGRPVASAPASLVVTGDPIYVVEP